MACKCARVIKCIACGGVQVFELPENRSMLYCEDCGASFGR